MFAWMRKGYGNLDRVSFWLGLHFLCPAQFLAELVHPDERNQLQPSTLLKLCGSSCKHPLFSTALLVIFFAWPFH